MQVATGTLFVLFGVQVVSVQLLPEVAALGEHEATAVGPVVIGAGQLVVM